MMVMPQISEPRVLVLERGGNIGRRRVVWLVVLDVFICPGWMKQMRRLESPWSRFSDVWMVEVGLRLVGPPNVGSIVLPVRNYTIGMTIGVVSLIGSRLAAHLPSTISIFANIHDFQFLWHL